MFLHYASKCRFIFYFILNIMQRPIKEIDMNTIKGRLITFIGSCTTKTGKKLSIRAFEESCNLGNGYVSKIDNSIGKEIKESITLQYPDLNWLWLLTGKGKMLIIDDQNENKLEENLYTVPLLPISAQAGSLNDFMAKVKESDCERIVSPIKGADFAMSVTGDSMSPEYPNGSQILIKKINERTYIEWGRVYVIDATNGTVIKIVNRSEKEGCIKCTSINSDQKRYEPFDLPMSEVLGMYRVMMCMAIK